MNIHKVNLNNLNTILDEDVDIFICCSSFEDRCLSIASNINRNKIKKAFIGLNENIKHHVDRNANVLKSLFSHASELVLTDSTDPIKTADSWVQALNNITIKPQKVLCDITTFTHEALLLILKIFELWNNKEITFQFVYCSAEEYDPPREGPDKWLSKGVADVRSVLGYPGSIIPSKKTHLIVLVGYEYERATRLIQKYEPNRISLGLSKPGSATSPKHETASIKFHKLATEMVTSYAPVEKFEFPCNNPWEAKDAILTQVNRYEAFNVVIAPMNTKISTVGCALAAWKNDSIQICYAQAFRYNYQNYSSPGKTCYLFNLYELNKK